MKKSLSKSKYDATTLFIDTQVTPKLHDLINTVNDHLKAKGVVIGVEFTWFIDELKEKEVSENE